MATGTAIWGDQLTANESAQLMRGGGTIPLPRPDVLVVGGGIVDPEGLSPHPLKRSGATVRADLGCRDSADLPAPPRPRITILRTPS